MAAYQLYKPFQASYLESLWMKAQRSKKAIIHVTNILPGYVDTDIVKGDTFWMSPVKKATHQIYTAIKLKKRKAYITKRWRLVALAMKVVPTRLLMRYFYTNR